MDGWSANKECAAVWLFEIARNRKCFLFFLFRLEKQKILHIHNTAGLRIIARQHNEKNFR